MRIIAAVAVALSICVLAGCGGETLPTTARARGVVTYKGAPVEGARVMFHPVDGGARTSYGTTDASGKFELSTFGTGDGALIGRHKVTITKAEMPTENLTKTDVEAMQNRGISAMPGYEGMMGVGGKPAEKPKMLLPDTYADKKKTTLEVEVVTDGKNQFPFELK